MWVFWNGADFSFSFLIAVALSNGTAYKTSLSGGDILNFTYTTTNPGSDCLVSISPA